MLSEPLGQRSGSKREGKCAVRAIQGGGGGGGEGKMKERMKGIKRWRFYTDSLFEKGTCPRNATGLQQKTCESIRLH